MALLPQLVRVLLAQARAAVARSLPRRGQGIRKFPLSPAVSIGMAAHGNARTTRKSLDALFTGTAGDFELILVDDQSPDDTLEVFREARRWHRNTRIFAFPRNLEYCQSVNAFLSHARGERLLFLSNDIFASPAYLRELLHDADAHPDCGILRGCSNFIDYGIPRNMVEVEPCESREAYFAFAEKIAARHRHRPLLDERYLVGDAFLVTRAVIERIGTFDTRFVGYFGDVDFGLRAQIAGFRVVLEPRAFAYHQTHANIARLPVEEQRQRWERRRRLLGDATETLLQKYGLQAVEGPIDMLPFEELARRPFEPSRHYVAPGDYSEYQLGDD